MTKTTVRGKIVAIQEGVYSNYVFQNLDEQESSEFRYITVTKCPNWQYFDTLKIGDEGFVTFEYAEAGKDYLDISTNTIKQYSYTAYYFMNFIKEINKDNTKEFQF